MQGVFKSATMAAESDKTGAWLEAKPEILRICTAFRETNPALWTPEVASAFGDLMRACSSSAV